MGCEKARVFAPDKTLKNKPEGEIKLAFFTGLLSMIITLFSPNVSFLTKCLFSHQMPLFSPNASFLTKCLFSALGKSDLNKTQRHN